MKIAYFTSCYPRASDSFIRVEVHNLRKQGFSLSTFSVRKPDLTQLTDEDIYQEYKNTRYLLDNYAFLFLAFFQVLFLHPVRFFQALCLALKTCSPGVKTHLWQAAYLMEASYLAKLLKQEKIDHIHNHIGEASATVAMFASTLSGIPFSLSIHGPGIFYHPERWALGEKIQRSQFTRCISEFCKSQCMAFSNRNDWKKLRIVHCGVQNQFLTSPLLPIPRIPKLLTIGRMESIKGFYLLIEAAEKLFQEKITFEFVIIGDGPQKKEIETAIREKKLENNIKLLGWINAAGIKKEMENSRAIVSTSFNEGLPVVFMEALAVARPVIAPRVSGIPELIIDGKTGFLYPAGSLDELVFAIKNVLNTDEKILGGMGKQGAQIIKENFNSEIETRKLAHLFIQKENS